MEREAGILKDALMATLRTPAAAESCDLVDDFETVVREHQKRIYRVLLFLVRDPDEADTLTQECFLRAYRRGASFRREAKLSTWLIRIAVNLARDQLRSRRRKFWRRILRGKETATIPIVDRRSTPEGALLVQEKLSAVWTAVESLPLRQRTVFTLRFGEEMTLGEIGEVLQTSQGAVKAHLSCATHAVRKALSRRDPHCAGIAGESRG